MFATHAEPSGTASATAARDQGSFATRAVRVPGARAYFTLVASLIAMSLLSGCDNDVTRPSDNEPDDVFFVDYMDGAPRHLNWGSRVTIRAFFPEQRSWQWVIGDVTAGRFPARHQGAEAVRSGTPCIGCHGGTSFNDEAAMGTRLVRIDPEPIAGKVGYKDVQVRAAYDAANIYLRVQWESERPGITHETYRFDGSNWVPNSRNKPATLGPNQHYSYEDRFAVIFAERNVRADPALPATIGYQTVGCWMTCHDNMRHMPRHPDVAGAQAFIGQNDVRKYLLTTRDGDRPKSAAAIAEMRANGEFLDLWQFRAARGAPVQIASDDYVLEYRNSDIGGTSAFFDQMPNDMRWMYDRNAVGFHAIPMSEYEQRIRETPLITNGPHKNAVPYDPAVGFAVGDILPRRLLRNAAGNRGDVTVYSGWKDGIWTVIFKRALVTANTTGVDATDKSLELAGGTVYTLGFGVFDDFTTSRRHFVTLPFTLGGETTNATVRARAN
jgi:hypothetical protein